MITLYLVSAKRLVVLFAVLQLACFLRTRLRARNSQPGGRSEVAGSGPLNQVKSNPWLLATRSAEPATRQAAPFLVAAF